MQPLPSVAQLCAEQGLTPAQLAEKAALPQERVRAILEGRWTPSPAERDKVAAVFGRDRSQVAWGHKSTVENLYGHGPQFGRTP